MKTWALSRLRLNGLSARYTVDRCQDVNIDRLFLFNVDRWSSRVFAPNISRMLQISPECSKIITYLPITPDLINIINRLYNIIIISKNTYKPWIKMDQIHGLSTPPDLPFCLSSSKTNMQSL